MRVVVQRVKYAKLSIEGVVKGEMDNGLVVYVGYGKSDQNKNDWLVNKICGLRVFEDDNNKLNLSVKDINGKIMVISNFTLCGNCQKGFRPSFEEAMEYNQALEMYKDLLQSFTAAMPNSILSGEFGADMQIEQINDGPVNIIIE